MRGRSTRRFCRTFEVEENLRCSTCSSCSPDSEPCDELDRRRPPQEDYHRLRHGRSFVCPGAEYLYCNQPTEITKFFRQFCPFRVVVEATASYQWFVELVEPLADAIQLANPKKLRVIAESTKKTDRLDAQVLAEFLAGHDPPVVYAHAQAAPAPCPGATAAAHSGPNHGRAEQAPENPQRLQRRPSRPVFKRRNASTQCPSR